MPNELMIVRFLEALSEQAKEQADKLYRRYELAYYEASWGELTRLSDEGDRLADLAHTLSYWARVFQYGFPDRDFRPEFHYPE